ncbi:hypothetical protein AB0L47_37730 [Streptomyces bobili]|uniref:hypothetical protein n=1 Tax=Streptomyces bobili TaxID=67280 RepID=UPI00344194D1
MPPEAGTRVHPDSLEATEETLKTGTITAYAPFSARTRSDWTVRRSDWTVRLDHPDTAWDVRSTTSSNRHLRRAYVYRDGRGELHGGPGGALPPHLGETVPANGGVRAVSPVAGCQDCAFGVWT